MKKTLLLCLALLLPVNIHSDDKLNFFVAASTIFVAFFTMAAVDRVCNSIEIAEQEKTKQEQEKTKQEQEKTKQLNLTIAIKNTES